MISQTQLITNLVTLLIFFALLFGFTKLLGPIPFSTNNIQSYEGFTVSGEGKVKATPDFATVTVGVTAKAATQQEAQNLLNGNINKVVASIKALGIDDKDIKTENYNIYPEYGDIRVMSIAPAPPTDENGITGYNTNTNITITLEDPTLADKVIDASTASGANQVGGVNYQVKDKENAMNEARTAAVADAKRKAENAAKAAGFRLGRITNYSESEGGGYPMPMMAKAEDARGGNVPTQTQPGEDELTMIVTISYEID